ncbi:MAG: hypothetical protein MMC23_001529 [Stictis urceolatum]|nr:hypothetical protein [Stictis urceolata]
MLSFAKLFAFAISFCVLAQTTLSLRITSPGFEAKLDRIIANAEAKAAEANGTEPTPDAPKGKSGGVFFMYPKADCKIDRGRPFLIRPIDKCFNIEESLSLKTPARCANGTNAQIAKFAGKKCTNPLKDPLMEVESSLVGKCMNTHEVASMAFWCDGVPGIDLTENQGKHCGSGKKHGMGIGIGFGVVFVFALIGGSIHFMWNRGLGGKVMGLFRRNDRGIRL